MDKVNSTKQAAEKQVPEPFHSWLCDLNSALNVLRHHKYDDQSIGYAENVHASYHKTLKEWQQSQQPGVVKLRNALQQIEQMSDPGSYETAIVRMKAIATNALKK